MSVSVESNSCRPHKPTNDGLLERPDINESLDVRGGWREGWVVSFNRQRWVYKNSCTPSRETRLLFSLEKIIENKVDLAQNFFFFSRENWNFLRVPTYFTNYISRYPQDFFSTNASLAQKVIGNNIWVQEWHFLKFWKIPSNIFEIRVPSNIFEWNFLPKDSFVVF